VQDDGTGFAVDDVAGGRGLGNLRSRAASVGLDLDIWSTPGAGTTVEARWIEPSDASTTTGVHA
jgi:signal transduction histidine kinase